MTRVLVVTYDQVGPRMAGPAIRAFELSRVLAAAGNEVVLGCRLKPEREGDGFAVRWCDDVDGGLDALVDDAEVVVAFGFTLAEFPSIVEQGKIVVADLYDPFTLEVLVQRADDPPDVRDREFWGALHALDEQLRRADLVLVASDRQRDLVFGMLAGRNRVNPETYDDDPSFDRLLAVVPFGLPAAEPVAGEPILRGVREGFGDDDLILLWAGGIYEWFDPLTLIEGVAALGADDVKLLFMGTQHPNPEVPTMPMAGRAVDLARSLGVLDRAVFFNEGWVPYDERVEYLLESDVGCSTHFRHAETAYSFRTRMLDYIWTGLPVLCTEGDTLADLVTRRDLGEVVPARSPSAVAGAISRLLDLDRRERCSNNLLELASELTWERVAAPLVSFCASPWRAADLRVRGGEPPLMPSEQHLVDVYESRMADLQARLEASHADVFKLRQDREGLLREIDELSAFREQTLSSLPYRAVRKLRGG